MFEARAIKKRSLPIRFYQNKLANSELESD